MDGKRQFLLQGLLLTAVSLLLRAVGVGSQVYISTRIGAEAVGVCSLIGGVSGFAVTLALSGIQLGCTRLVSEGLGHRNQRLVRRTMTCAVCHALIFGILACALLFFGAEMIGSLWLHDLRTVRSLRIIALTLPTTALTSCLAGYFVAVRRVWKSACVQVAEEVLRVVCTVVLLSRTVGNGLESALISLAQSNAIADTLACIAMVVLFVCDKNKHLATQDLTNTQGGKTPLSYAAVARRLLSVTLPVATATYARSGLITLEHMLIPVGLEHFGQAHSTALASYGTLHSMALPVVLFPCALLGSFAGLLVPELTEAHVRGENARIRYVMGRVFWMTLTFSIGVAGVLICFSRELGLFLYGSEEAAHYIRVLAPLIPVMYMDSATDAMLKGLGQQVYSMNVNIADASISVLLVWLLLPAYGIRGYVITIYVTELLNAALSIARLWEITHLKTHVCQWVFKPLLAAVLSTAMARALLQLLPSAMQNGDRVWKLVAHITLACLCYGITLLAIGAWRREDRAWLRSFVKK